MPSASPHCHGSEAPSAWVQRWSHLLPPAAKVLDVACGQGRHMRWLSGLGHQVTGVDRSGEALEVARQWGEVVLADIENQAWPLLREGRAQTFDAVVVTNYLWRALLPVIGASVRPGGLLIYETFAVGNETVGKPSRPDFLLRHGELLQAYPGWHIVAYEDGFLEQPARFVQRLAAIAAIAPDTAPMGRYPL
ncbi:MAG: class I SAM-dependent methyltransferase [Hylemonella sp.]|jgi:SAM-dependent methyltransferase